MTKTFAMPREMAAFGVACENCGHHAKRSPIAQGEFNIYDNDERYIVATYQCGECGSRHIVTDFKRFV